MKISELITFLQTLDQDTEIIREAFSDYWHLKPEEITLVWGIYKPSANYIMRYNPKYDRVSVEERKLAKQYYLIPGN